MEDGSTIFERDKPDLQTKVLSLDAPRIRVYDFREFVDSAKRIQAPPVVALLKEIHAKEIKRTNPTLAKFRTEKARANANEVSLYNEAVAKAIADLAVEEGLKVEVTYGPVTYGRDLQSSEQVEVKRSNFFSKLFGRDTPIPVNPIQAPDCRLVIKTENDPKSYRPDGRGGFSHNSFLHTIAMEIETSS